MHTVLMQHCKQYGHVVLVSHLSFFANLLLLIPHPVGNLCQRFTVIPLILSLPHLPSFALQLPALIAFGQHGVPFPPLPHITKFPQGPNQYLCCRDLSPSAGRSFFHTLFWTLPPLVSTTIGFRPPLQWPCLRLNHQACYQACNCHICSRTCLLESQGGDVCMLLLWWWDLSSAGS